MPASFGVQGPGEMHDGLRLLCERFGAVILSLRTTCILRPIHR